MNPTTRLIINGWLITQIFYLFFYYQTGMIFGKSDITNYLNMNPAEMTQSIYTMRHILIGSFIYYLPGEIFLFFIPALYWFGIVWPISRLWPDNGVFCFVLGTSSMGLCFIVGLLSQFLAMSFLVWAVYHAHRGRRRLSYVLILLSLVYSPILFFYLVAFAPIWASISATLVFMIVFPAQLWYAPAGWFPLWGFLFYISPVLLIKFIREAPETNLIRVFILSLTRSSRGLIFMLPFIRQDLDRTEKALTVLWCLSANFVILLGYIIEKGHF